MVEKARRSRICNFTMAPSLLSPVPVENFRPVIPQELKNKTDIYCDDIQSSYQVEGLRLHELPVVGFVVHENIIPGFSYRVRPLNNTKYLFSGQAHQLASIGPGYGKRITFKADAGSKNDNSNYFWSDSRPEGFGFELEAVSPGMSFVMLDSMNYVIGTCEITQNKGAQIEQSQVVKTGGKVEKRVLVNSFCKIVLKGNEVQAGWISGIAIAVKPSRSSAAALDRITYCNIECHYFQAGQLQQSKLEGLTLISK